MQEWSPRDFEALLRDHFDDIQLYSQIRRTTPLADMIKLLDVFKLRTRMPLTLTRQVAASAGVRTIGDVNISDIVIVREIHNTANEIVAICN